MISGNIFKTLFLFAAGAALIASCDSEYNDIGADIIEGDIHHNGMERYEGSIVAYDRPTGKVQTNNLPFNSLGIYNNPAFGKTTSHFVTQLELGGINPKFSAPVVDSVYLYVPYYSNFQATDASTGNSTYTLTSGYRYPEQLTNETMTLRVFHNKFFLRSSDPSEPVTTSQKYYSDDKGLIEGALGQMLGENTQFKISADEVHRVVTLQGSSVQKIADRFAPGIFMNLDTAFFQTMILNQSPDGNLANNNIFKEFLRGIYFQITENGGPAGMVMPRFNEGRIVIVYKDHPLRTNGTYDTGATKVTKTYTLNLKGNTVNFFDNDFAGPFTTGIGSSDPVLGDERLYLKGGEGSMAIINVLNTAEIADLKARQILINEANLTFYADQDAMDASPTPLRVYLYDLKNKRPLYDYYVDATVNNQDQKFDKYIFSGLGGTLANEPQQVLYKVRLTNHINNVINKDSTNISLGLVLTENINFVSNAALRAPFTEGDVNVTTVPATSVVSPLGTVFHGSRSADANKRLKLEIYYTKPN